MVWTPVAIRFAIGFPRTLPQSPHIEVRRSLSTGVAVSLMTGRCSAKDDSSVRATGWFGKKSAERHENEGAANHDSASGGLVAWFAAAFGLTFPRPTRRSAIVVDEDRSLDLVGDIGNELRRSILKFRGLLQQISYSSYTWVFQVDAV
jgi:hypothetical protein